MYLLVNQCTGDGKSVFEGLSLFFLFYESTFYEKVTNNVKYIKIYSFYCSVHCKICLFKKSSEMEREKGRRGGKKEGRKGGSQRQRGGGERERERGNKKKIGGREKDKSKQRHEGKDKEKKKITMIIITIIKNNIKHMNTLSSSSYTRPKRSRTLKNCNSFVNQPRLPLSGPRNTMSQASFYHDLSIHLTPTRSLPHEQSASPTQIHHQKATLVLGIYKNVYAYVWVCMCMYVNMQTRIHHTYTCINKKK